MTDLQLILLIIFGIVLLYPYFSKGTDMLLHDLGIVLKYLAYGIIALIAWVIRRVR